MALTHVPVAPLPPQRFRELLGDRYGELEEAIAQARERFAGRAVWHVNSTARGGGVAELLQSLLAYARGGGVDTRWVVWVATRTSSRSPSGSTTTFTARLGTAAHWARRSTRCTTRRSAKLRRSWPTRSLRMTSCSCTIRRRRGSSSRSARRGRLSCGAATSASTRRTTSLAQAWDFLRGYVEEAQAYVFSREEFVWEGLDREKVWIVAPSIDAFSPKNQELDAER